MQIYKAQNVNEAVEIAKELKRKGVHDWFRGQTKNWSLRSSFTRLAKRQQEEALGKLGRFEHWVKSTPGLEALAAHPDSMIAVGQHYGLATNFIDFTTEPTVAGFFASEKADQQKEEPSVILCLNTADLREFWSHMPSKYPPPEFLRLEVPNLWRLEAQSGVFLFCPYANFEHIYDLDRILFPCTAPLSRPARDEVYPRRKSQLEVLLDQYFMNETLIEGSKAMEEIIPPSNVLTIPRPPNNS